MISPQSQKGLACSRPSPLHRVSPVPPRPLSTPPAVGLVQDLAVEGPSTSASVIVNFTHQELLHPNLDTVLKIERAYGPRAHGVATVSGIPDFALQRSLLLPQAFALAVGWQAGIADLPAK